jgi:hypothetical protein
VSVMDAGVGAVAFAGGLVSRAASGAPPRTTPVALKRALICALLGAAKGAVAAVLSLPLHASEYGTHWNFFCTLTVLCLFDDFAVSRLFPERAGGVQSRYQRTRACGHTLVALLLLIFLGASAPIGLAFTPTALRFPDTHAATPMCTADARAPHKFFAHSVEQFALCAPRVLPPAATTSPALDALVAVFVANREGILSTLGFVTLHCAGVAVAAAARVSGGGGVLRAAAWGAGLGVVALVSFSAAWPAGGALYGADAVLADGYPVSRRLANAPYVAWSLFLNCAALFAWEVTVRALPFSELPRTLTALGDAFLPAFLVANVLTGAVNALADALWGGALDAPPVAAAVLLISHGLAVGAVARAIAQWRAQYLQGGGGASVK